jgi:sarcosine oxidase subunit alpha
MSTSDGRGGGRRLPTGGTRIDRSAPIRFTFEGRAHEGFRGDTLASALLANGVDIVARSLYDDRPRGIISAGPEEPAGLVAVRGPAAEEPMLRATLVELVEGLEAWGLPGRGTLSAAPDRGRFDRTDRHVETLVIGAGSAGRAAAREAAGRGDRVLLVDQEPVIEDALALTGLPEMTVLTRARALGVYDHGYVTIAEHRPYGAVEGRLWHVRAARIVIATGAIERPIVFADDDRPGIMLASAAARYLDRYAVRPGSRAAIFTTNSSTDGLAERLTAAGTEVAAVVDTRDGDAVVGTECDAAGHLAGIRVGRLDGTGPYRDIEVDLLLVSGGWNPDGSLWSQGRGTLRFDTRIAAFVPDVPFGAQSAVGAVTGEGLPDVTPVWLVPPADPQVPDAWASHYVDLQRDSTVAHLRRALDAGLTSIEHVKRYTTIGTAGDQGKTSGVVASAIAAAVLGQDVGAVGVPTYRPPTTPVPFALIAGRDLGDRLDPIRTTPIHAWHVANGAVFEDVGQWRRPFTFPRDGESEADAVLRECAAARTGVALMDASTLGKIDLQGPDAGVLLDRLYTGRFSTLAVGACKYAVMCGLDGMVMDDGVISRLAEDRYHVTTTTGGAAGVMDHIEEYLQTEWPDLRVHATSVTEAWSTIAVVGPRSRDVVAALVPDVDVSAEAFPFMTWRHARIAGTPGRISRISFSGELAYELDVPGDVGRAAWEAVIRAGEPFGITPYGTEALHVLRAEKGYPIIGQETDGTVTPDDLGLGWAIARGKDFIGRRSLRRPDALRTNRRQLVGLLPVDPDALIPEGAQLVATDSDLERTPVPMRGWVTSAYRSAALGRTFALALLEAGRSRHGERLRAVLPDRVIDVVVTDPVFYDPRGARRDGDGAAVVVRAPGAPSTELPELPELAARRAFDGLRLPAAVLPLPAQSHVAVRVDPSDEERRLAIEARLGVALPLEPNTVTATPDGLRRVAWLGPDEWLVIDAAGADPTLERELRELVQTGGALVDVSAGRAGLVLSGSTARVLLEHGCSVDLHPRSFGPGRAAQTALALTHVLVLAMDGAPTYWVYVRPSFAGYLADWLTDAALSGD